MYVLSLLYYYLGSVRVIFSLYYAVGWVLIFSKERIKRVEFLTLLFVFLYVIVKVFQTGSFVAPLLYIRLYWGFIFLYFLCRRFKLKDPASFFIICAVLTIVEYIAIRVNLSIKDILLNYDGTFDRQVEYLGLIGGVHSFGANRTVTGSLMLAAYIFFDTRKEYYSPKIKYLMLFSSFICFSGTSFILMVVYFLYKKSKSKIIIILLPLLAVGVFFLQSIWTRIQWKYIEIIYIYKSKQIMDNFEFLTENFLSLLFGTAKIVTNSLEVESYGMLVGDFSFLDFFLRNGLIGLIFFIYFVYSNVNKNNFIVIVFLLISTLHYHVIFSFPGQMFFAYFLSLTEDSYQEQKLV